MREYETISINVDDRGVANLQLAEPQKRNALSETMIKELTEFAMIDAKSEHIKVAVLSGQGEYFCAGGDLNWMKAQITADRDTRIKEASKIAYMLKALNEMPIPLIGKIHGGAFGGGVGLCCICDVVIADENAKFGLTETRLGLIPATIGPYVIARMGEGNARQVFMSARIFDANEAQSLGVVSRVCQENELDERVEFEIKPYLSTAPNAVGAAKAFVRSLGSKIDESVVDDSIHRLADAWEKPEAEEGIDAFFNKRKPNWVREE